MSGVVADKDLNYLNMKEIKDFCNRVGIPYKIHHRRDGKLRVSGEIDSKSIILERIRGYIKNRDIGQPTVYSKKVVCFDPLPKVIIASDRIFYGQYKTTHKNILSLMKDLTDGKFTFGAISQEVIRDFWREEKTPTYRQFAQAWVNGVRAHTKPKPEWAYLTDLAAGMERKAWKALRQEKAKSVIDYLHQLKE